MNREERAKRLLGAPERRDVARPFEVRADGNTVTLTGYASVTEVAYDVFGGPKAGGWSETIARGGFGRTLSQSPDLHLLVNHAGLPLARTKSGTLSLSEDKVGLAVTSPLDLRDPDVQALRVKMERGDIDEMSFAFRANKQEWNDDYTERRILEVNLNKGDVSIVNFGANPATSGAQLRGALDMLAELGAEEMAAELRSLDSPLVALRAARDTIDRLIREATPPAKRTLSLAEAERLAV